MGGVRLAEMMAALSLATDAGTEQPPEKSLRTSLLATRLGESHGIQGAPLSDIYYTAMLRFIGCTSYATELGRVFGEDGRVLKAFEPTDDRHPLDAMKVMATEIGAWESGLGRARIVAKAIADMRNMGKLVVADCEVGTRLATRLGLGPGVVTALGQTFERWDGKGGPAKLKGEESSLAVRVALVAQRAEAVRLRDGRDAARAFIARGSGAWFDPAVADAFLARADALFDEIEADSVWDAVLDAEPAPVRVVPDAQVDAIAEAFGDFADLKCAYTLGHSANVAALAVEAARSLGVSDDDVVTLRRAARVHDLGRVSVAAGVWDSPKALTAAQWERVRLHAYQTERVLAPAPVFAAVARTACMHHERMDGSGYHRNASGASLPQIARILAAADVYEALTHARPHRPAFDPEAAAKELRAEAEAGRLDADAVSAVLRAAGHAGTAARAPRPAGLSDREVEVLRLLARGMSKKEIAKALFISPSTAHTHVVHIYEKTGLSSRAGVALFAMEHGLIDPA